MDGSSGGPGGPTPRPHGLAQTPLPRGKNKRDNSTAFYSINQWIINWSNIMFHSFTFIVIVDLMERTIG